MNTQQNAKKILFQIFEETKFSGVDDYPIEIRAIQEELKLSDADIKTALDLLSLAEMVFYRAIDKSMIQLSEKGKLQFRDHYKVK